MVNLIDLDEKVLARILVNLPCVEDVCKLGMTSRATQAKLKSASVCSALMQHFFYAPDLMTDTEKDWPSVDPCAEFWTLARLRCQSLHHPIKVSHISSNEQKIVPVDAAALAVEDGQCTQLVAPLQPLPVGSGRLKYVEFRIEDMKENGERPNIVFGIGLPGIQGNWLGKTKNSACVNFSSNMMLNGTLYPKAILNPAPLSAGRVIGIGMCFESHDDEQQTDCFFATCDGNLIGESHALNASFRGHYLSTIFASQASLTLSVNFGDKPFVFDVKAFQKSHGPSTDFYHSYLQVSDKLFNSDGETAFWTTPLIAQSFAYYESYLPVAKAMESLADDPYVSIVASCQRQLHQWHSLYRYLHEQLRILSPSKIPIRLGSQVALDIAVTAADLEPFPVDFKKDLESIEREIWMNMTKMRWNIQLMMVKAAITHLRERKSLFEDNEEIRGGTFEGWLKLAAFLSDNVDEPTGTNDWLDFVRDATLERLLESGFDLESSCPGYIDAVVEKPAGEKPDDDVREEERNANYIVAIGATVEAYAIWLGTFVAHLESQLKSRATSSRALPYERILNDATLTTMSNALFRGAKDGFPRSSPPASPRSPDDAQIPSYAWIMMQYISLGFARGSTINCIPLAGKEAASQLAEYFQEAAKHFSDSDYAQIVADAGKLMDSQGNIEELTYLKHQWQLATGEWPTAGLVAKSLLLELPPQFVSELSQNSETGANGPLGTKTPQKALPKLPEAPPSTTQDTKSPRTPASPSPSGWAMTGAFVGIAILSAAIGAGLVLLTQSKRASPTSK